MSRILVVDDELSVRTSFNKLLSKDGHDVRLAASGEEALALLSRELPDVMLMDVRMAGLSGLDTLQRAKAQAPKVPVIIMTAHGTADTAIQAMKLGAFEYVLKPFDVPALKQLIDQAVEAGRLMRVPVAFGTDELPGPAERIIGQSPAMYAVYKLIGQVAPLPVTVLLLGESGTGKELVARAVYHHSARADKPFLAVNCAAIPETLLESELFGYEKGAFTGAITRRPGRFEQTHGGTIFLDEVADMSLATQAKVLRVLQERTLERLGSHEPISVDVRVIAATNKPLEQLVQDGRFREDLFYRLKVVTIQVPPLRDRALDVPLLAAYFLARHGKELGKSHLELSAEALQRLTSYQWPGNVRELENCLRQAVALSKGPILLPDDLRLGSGEADRSVAGQDAGSLRAAAKHALATAPGRAFSRLIDDVECELILEALGQTRGNLTQAAKLLGITRPTLREKIAKHKIARTLEFDRSDE